MKKLVLFLCFIGLFLNFYAQPSLPIFDEFKLLPEYSLPNIPIDGDGMHKMIYSTEIKKLRSPETLEWNLMSQDSMVYKFGGDRGTVRMVNDYDSMYQYDQATSHLYKIEGQFFNVMNRPIYSDMIGLTTEIREQRFYDYYPGDVLLMQDSISIVKLDVSQLINVEKYSSTGRLTYHRYSQSVPSAYYIFNYEYKNTFSYDELDRLLFKTYELRAPVYGANLNKTDVFYHYFYSASSTTFPSSDSIIQHIYSLADTMSILETNVYKIVRTFDTDGYPTLADYYYNGELYQKVLSEYIDGLLMTTTTLKYIDGILTPCELETYSYNSEGLVISKDLDYSKVYVLDMNSVSPELEYLYTDDMYHISQQIYHFNDVLNLDSLFVWNNQGIYFDEVEMKYENLYENLEEYRYYYTLPTSTEYSIDSIDLSVFPNPASEVINIENHKMNAVVYQIYNMQGKLVKQEELPTAKNVLIDIVNLEPGLFLLKLIDKDNNRATIKFVKR